MTRRKTEITATVLWSLATKGTQEFKNKSPQPLSRISEFGFGRNWEFAARTCSLATEGTQEFPPLKKTVMHEHQKPPLSRITFCRFATMRVAYSCILYCRIFATELWSLATEERKSTAVTTNKKQPFR